MGSSGSGNFGNYQPTEVDNCGHPITVDLEEVAREEYFVKHGSFPPVGTQVRLRPKTTSGRFVVETSRGSESVGLLPTTLHYLVLCLKKGYTYDGEVTALKGKKVPVITVDLVANEP